MKNPYILGMPVDGPDFYGRQALLDDLLVSRHQCIYLVANRRMGKTSALRFLKDRATDVTLLLNLQATGGDPGRMGEGLARVLNRRANQKPILQKLHLDGPCEISHMLQALSEFVEDEGISIWLLWDEAEKLLDMGKECLEALRSIFQDQKSLRVVLAATKALSELNDRFRPWRTTPFLFGFTTRYIPPLSRESAQDLICQANYAEGPVRVSEDLQDQIMDLTGNHPYLIQVLCDRLFQQDGHLRPIKERDLVVDRPLADIFQIDYDMLSRSERSILHELSEKGPLGETKLQADLELNLDRLRQHLYGLEQLGYVRCTDRGYEVGNSFLHRWLRMGDIKESRGGVSDEASVEVISRALADSLDIYSRYKAAVRQLLEHLGQDHPRRSEALVYQQRLIENIDKTIQHGDTETRRAGRSEIIQQLETLTQAALGLSFHEL